MDGLSLKFGATTPNILEAEVARTMVERTRGPVVVLADHSKVGVVADFLSVPLERIDVLITDANVNQEFVQDLQAAGVRVIVAGESPAALSVRRIKRRAACHGLPHSPHVLLWM